MFELCAVWLGVFCFYNNFDFPFHPIYKLDTEFVVESSNWVDVRDHNNGLLSLGQIFLY